MERGACVKVVMLGSDYSGKTSLTQRYIYNNYITNPAATICVEYSVKQVDVNGKRLRMQIWDTAGNDAFDSLTRTYCRGVFAAIICYELTNDKSFEKARFWGNELKQIEENCKIYLCGTKKDLVTGDDRNRRKVDYSSVTDYATEIGAEVFEISSKTGEQVKELFDKIALDYDEFITKNPPQIDKDTVHLEEERKQEGGCF